MKYSIILFLQLFTGTLLAQLSPQKVLEKAIRHHDPNGSWARFHQRLHFRVSIPNQADTFSVVEIDNRRRYFNYIARDGKRTIEKGFNDRAFFAIIDGKEAKSAVDIQRFRLSREKVSEVRDFFTYVIGLPMRLTETGARLSPKLQSEIFNGEACWVLRVDYPTINANNAQTESWLFYINKGNYAMRGSRFIRNNNVKNGAYIVFEGETTIKGINLPQTRHWFWSEDDRFLATETIESARDFEAGLASRL